LRAGAGAGPLAGWGATAGALALLGCATAASPRAARPCSEGTAAATVLATARTDLGCPAERLAIALELHGTVSKGTARFLVDGRGERALYIEACKEAPPDTCCRYLIASRIPLAGPAPSAAAPR